MNLIGRTLAQYRIPEPLGQGGMVIVYKTHCPALERHAALKVPPAQYPYTLFSARFPRQARTPSQLNHSNILPLPDVVQTGNPSRISRLAELMPHHSRSIAGGLHVPGAG